MYYLAGSPLLLDRAFVDADGTQYPANWLRDSTQQQRDALGIVWLAPNPPAGYDQRFYWGVDNPKDIDQLKVSWIRQQKQTANSLLTPTDWYVIRMTEDVNCMCPPEVVQYRADVRAASNNRETEIDSCLDTEELETLVKEPSAMTPWPDPLS